MVSLQIKANKIISVLIQGPPSGGDRSAKIIIITNSDSTDYKAVIF